MYIPTHILVCTWPSCQPGALRTDITTHIQCLLVWPPGWALFFTIMGLSSHWGVSLKTEWVSLLSWRLLPACLSVFPLPMQFTGFPGGSAGKESTCNAGDLGSIPGLGRYPGEGNGNLLQYSCLGNLMDQGVWQTAVYGGTSQTQLRD